MTETKQDVFDDLLGAYSDAIAGGGQGDNDHPAEYRLRYRCAKNEDIIIPANIAEYILRLKENDKGIETAFGWAYNNSIMRVPTVNSDWIMENPDVFARAWLDGYTIEGEQTNEQED